MAITAGLFSLAVYNSEFFALYQRSVVAELWPMRNSIVDGLTAISPVPFTEAQLADILQEVDQHCRSREALAVRSREGINPCLSSPVFFSGLETASGGETMDQHAHIVDALGGTRRPGVLRTMPDGTPYPDRGTGNLFVKNNAEGLQIPDPQTSGMDTLDNGFDSNFFHFRQRENTMLMTLGELGIAVPNDDKAGLIYSGRYLRGVSARQRVSAVQPSAAASWTCQPVSAPSGLDCDEFPFGSTFEGGIIGLNGQTGFGIKVEPWKRDLNLSHNRRAGGALVRFYTKVRRISGGMLLQKAVADGYGSTYVVLIPWQEPSLRFSVIAPKTNPVTFGFYQGVFLL
jgi:hypothetical protein